MTELPSTIDTGAAHMSRVYDYWLGGHNHFKADREAAEAAIAANPMIVLDVRAARRFLARVVSYLIEDAGIRQFLDIGSGLPTARNIHEVAQSIAPDSKVLYVDNDPVVHRHARTLLASERVGVADFLLADLRQADRILSRAAYFMDMNEPIALISSLVLHMIPSDEQPWELVSALYRPLPPGSHVVITHPANDIRPAAIAEMQRRLNERLGSARGTARSHAEVARFFAGLELLEPGIVQPQRWRPTGPVTGADVPLWVGVGRRP